jgi:hypothetical protein
MSEPRLIHGHTRAEWERMCLNKRRYADEPIARATAAHQMEVDPEAPQRLFTYRCVNCRGWHLTRSPSNNGVPVTKKGMYLWAT